jgi:ribosomal protein L40E
MRRSKKHFRGHPVIQLLPLHYDRSRRCSPWLGVWHRLTTKLDDDDLFHLYRVLIQMPEFDDAEGYEVKKLSGSPRYCRMCRAYKPPRAHHCKTCRKYVFRDLHPHPYLSILFFLVDACFAWVSVYELLASEGI